jgi:hypothetical protein
MVQVIHRLPRKEEVLHLITSTIKSPNHTSTQTTAPQILTADVLRGRLAPQQPKTKS